MEIVFLRDDIYYHVRGYRWSDTERVVKTGHLGLFSGAFKFFLRSMLYTILSGMVRLVRRLHCYG